MAMVSMVMDHWSNNAMVSIDRSPLMSSKRDPSLGKKEWRYTYVHIAKQLPFKLVVLIFTFWGKPFVLDVSYFLPVTKKLSETMYFDWIRFIHRVMKHFNLKSSFALSDTTTSGCHKKNSFSQNWPWHKLLLTVRNPY